MQLIVGAEGADFKVSATDVGVVCEVPRCEVPRCWYGVQVGVMCRA